MFLFFVFAVIAVISAAMVVTLKNVMHCALFLALFLLNVAGIFFTFEADFLGVVQILLYVGGVIVLILFAIMLTARVSSALLEQTNEQKVPAFFISLAVLAGMIVVTVRTAFSASENFFREGVTRKIGDLLMTVYVLPFEIASVILLVALIGAIVLVGRKEE